MTHQQDGKQSRRSSVLRESNILTFFVPKTALALSVNELLQSSGHEETWQSITVTRPVESGGCSVTRVTIDSSGTSSKTTSKRRSVS